jgi:hypothetical protein
VGLAPYLIRPSCHAELLKVHAPYQFTAQLVTLHVKLLLFEALFEDQGPWKGELTGGTLGLSPTWTNLQLSSCHVEITSFSIARWPSESPIWHHEMSPASPRKSVDSLASGASTPSLSQYSLNQLESPRVPAQRYPLRRGSTASSIASIGGILDSSSRHGSIAESGQNGTLWHYRAIHESDVC